MTYADGSSGHQTDASEDSEPLRRRRQGEVYRLVVESGFEGITVQEVRSELGVHHGIASSALSNLHMDGSICKLAERRNGCGIYVLQKYINGDETIPHRRNRR